MPPLPGPDWIRPNFGDLQPLQVQSIDARLFTTLGITARQGFTPILSPVIFATVPLPIEGAQTESTAIFADADTVGDSAFVGGWDLGAPGAGTFQHAELFNPVGSGRVVFVDAVQVNGAGAALSYMLGSRASALGTLIGTCFNRNVGAAPSVAEVRNQGFPAAMGAPTVNWRAIFQVVLNETYTQHLSPPVRLAPGQGLIVGSQVANTQSRGIFFLREYLGT